MFTLLHTGKSCEVEEDAGRDSMAGALGGKGGLEIEQGAEGKTEKGEMQDEEKQEGKACGYREGSPKKIAKTSMAGSNVKTAWAHNGISSKSYDNKRGLRRL